MSEKIDVLQAWFDRIWTAGAVEEIPEFLTANSASKGILPDMAVSATDMPELVQLMRAQLGPIEVTLPQAMVSGDWISALVEVTSHNVETGDPVHVFGQIMARFDGPKMAEVYHSFDFLTYFEQLGQLPPNALALLLTGNQLE